jgi:UDP-N-acetyl-D-mannosaminuronic acid dehydrogenase
VNISVIGLGDIGLPTAALFAQNGHRVYGYDVNAQLRRSLQRGCVPSTEEPVRQAVLDALHSGRLHIVDKIPAAAAYIMCLPTPTSDGKPDLRFVEAGASAVAEAAQAPATIVLESTVPPGTTERVVERALNRHGKSIADFNTSFCQFEIALTSTTVAEFVKVVENTFRDVNVAFANAGGACT